MSDKEKLQAIKDEIERRIKNLSLILNIGNTEELTKEEEYGHYVEQETLKSLLIFINSFQEYPSPKFKIGNTIRDKEGKTGAFTITDIKVEDKSLVYLGNKRQKVSIWCQDDYEIVNNDLLVKEESTSEDLEEEITECYKSRNDLMMTRKQFGELIHRFTEWKKQQMKEALQTEYEKGLYDMREEIMKDAVDATIFSELKDIDGSLFQAKSDRFRMNGVKISDIIKVIPIKPEQQ